MLFAFSHLSHILLPVYKACGLGLLEIVKRTQEKATFSAQDLQAYTVRWWSYASNPTFLETKSRATSSNSLIAIAFIR
ncbi:hypothetical protein NC652_013987 [Populus alba x Populus x berolinensis]|nr:hypothetical protein NC652_013987 [Populus alba x Populus x berolinensis]